MGSCTAFKAAPASRAAAALHSLAMAIVLAAGFACGPSSSANAGASDGITAAIEIETDTVRGSSRHYDEPIEAQVRPHWCASTGALVDNIHKLGGESVVRLELDGDRALERYRNASEEVVIEHDRDGNSCLVEIRPLGR